MLNNIFLKTLRDFRFQILIWGGGLGLVMLANGASYNATFGTGPDRAKLIEDYRKAVESFTILTGKIYDLDTFGGFIISKVGSTMPVLLGIWALLAGSGLLRAEEERGSLDLLQSTPVARSAVLLQKWAGLLAALLGILVLNSLGLILAAAVAQAELSPLAAVMAHLVWGLLALVYGALALLFAQLTTRKAAAGWAGGLLAGTYLLNNLVLNVEALAWTQYGYPFYYAGLSQPLARSVGVNWPGLTVLLLITALTVALALWIYLRRDLNNYYRLFRPEAARPGPARQVAPPASTWLLNNFTFGLRAALPGVLIWGFSIAAYLLLIMSVFNDIKTSMLDLLSRADIYRQLGFANLTTNESILSVFVFVFLVLLVAAYAVVQVAAWTTQENEGRLELLLSAPVARWRVLLSYFAVAVVSSALLVGLLGAVFAACCLIFNIPVNPVNSLAAFAGLWVVCVVVAAIGYVLAAFGPARAVGLTAGLVILSYLTDLLEDLLQLPAALVNLSVFRQYGQPLSEGWRPVPQLLMLAAALIFIAVALVRFRRRDITK